MKTMRAASWVVAVMSCAMIVCAGRGADTDAVKSDEKKPIYIIAPKPKPKAPVVPLHLRPETPAEGKDYYEFCLAYKKKWLAKVDERIAETEKNLMSLDAPKYRHPALREAREAAIMSTRTLLTNLRAKRKSVQEQEYPVPPIWTDDVQVGSYGILTDPANSALAGNWPPAKARVIQIVSPGECIAQAGKTTVLLRGFDMSTFYDGKEGLVEGLVKVAGTYRYAAVDGSARTIPVVEAFDPAAGSSPKNPDRKRQRLGAVVQSVI